MKTTCVAHLVRAGNGPEVFRRFLWSYLRNDAGAPHRLLLVMKGFRGPADLGEYDRLLKDVPHDRIHVRDFGYDIRPYVVAARRTGFDRYCFLNSFSVILDRDWLAKLVHHMDAGGGVVGATGSWVSHVTDALKETDLRYHSLVVRRPAALVRMGRAAKIAILRHWFDPYPNYHVRTNCFLVGRERMLEFAGRMFLTKYAVYGFESARWGLSRRAKDRNLPLLVVGRDGKAYREDEWAESNTFWQHDQENLLVADNQTSRYEGSDLAARASLARWVWAERANPAVPGVARPATR